MGACRMPDAWPAADHPRPPALLQDAYRRFKGPDGYQRLDFVSTNVQQAAVAVTGMRMLDNSSAEIRWRLTGKLGVLPIDVAGAGSWACSGRGSWVGRRAAGAGAGGGRRVHLQAAPDSWSHRPPALAAARWREVAWLQQQTRFPRRAGTTEIEMNLLTGRIERHREKWDLAACSPPAAAAWNASRALWAAKQVGPRQASRWRQPAAGQAGSSTAQRGRRCR